MYKKTCHGALPSASFTFCFEGICVTIFLVGKTNLKLKIENPSHESSNIIDQLHLHISKPTDKLC